ncbi:MAG: MFS transporter, partial [Candidatus Nanopelagicales bacterium]|nr:MFS transporter [Candidatus Nanopelagicales bacterium]MCF8538130.1 MFS transporter [Candidatus Nanopelagicales bacterium]MCF8543135.1 MFS transporter [Candidatus Nanopelagicales bacterium]
MSPVRTVGRALRRTPLLAGLPREVAVVTAVAFCVALGFGILIPVLPVFARTFDISALEASAVVSVFALVRFVTSPLAGGMVDRFGERSVMTSGLLIVSVSSFAAGFSQTYSQLLMLRGVGGLGSSMFTVSAMALLLRVVSTEQRGRASGAFQGGFIIGGVAGPAVGGLVVAWSIRAPFFVYAGTLLLAALVAIVFLSRTRLHDLEHEVSHGAENKLQQLRTALKDRAYQAAITTNLVTGFVVFGLRSSAVPLFVVEGLGESASISGIGFLIAAGLQALLLLPAGRMADTSGRRKALLWGTIGTALGMLVLTGADIAANGWGTPALAGTGLFFLAMAIQGASGAFLGSAPAAVVGDVMGGKKGGIVVATFQMMADLGAILGPLMAGLIIDAADFDWAFGVGAILCIIAIGFVIRMPETLRRSQPQVDAS